MHRAGICRVAFAFVDMPKGLVRNGGLHSSQVVSGLSTWKIQEKEKPVFQTENKDRYRTKEENLALESTEWVNPPLRGLETERRDLRDRSVAKFKRFSSKFGSAVDMFRKVWVN